MTWPAWRGALLWATAILVGTSIPGSGLPRVPTGTDKIAHFALYGLLGWLVARALRADRAVRGGTVAIALVAMAAFAALDELHQSYIPGRSADRIDWIADVAGAAAGLLLLVTPTLRSEQRI